MSFAVEPLPDAFALAAWRRITQEIDASPEMKSSLQGEVMRLHRKNATKRDFLRGMGLTLYDKPWDWPRGRAIIEERSGEVVCDQDLIEALYQWFTSSAHQLYRRGQIRASLADGFGHVIRVSAEDDGRPVPCDAIDQQVLMPSEDVLKRIPPCSHPFCRCRWSLIYPD